MKTKIILTLLAVIVCAVLVDAVFRKPHQFSAQECAICHIDAQNSPDAIKSDVTHACTICHQDQSQTSSHPTDVYPSLSIPNDMPLMEGRLTCLTCHFGHVRDDASVARFDRKQYFLRRPIRGVIFCSSCHKIDEQMHIVFRNVHKGVYEETDSTTRIDQMSLDCIECHDAKISDTVSSLGSGRWNHMKRSFNHPIGISYKDVSRKKSKRFQPLASLRKEVKLYNGKIGCGTCHNVYSREEAMLSMNNRGSMLCIECHIK